MNKRRRVSRSRSAARSRGGAQSFFTKKNIIIISCAAAAIIIAAVVLIVLLAGNSKNVNPDEVSVEKLMELKFDNGVSVEGIDVSGMKFKEAIDPVKAKAETMLDELNVKYIIEEEEHSVSAYEMGAYIDYAVVMKEAMFGEAKDYPLNYEIDKAKLTEAITPACEEHTRDAKDATVALDVDSNEETLTVSADIVYTDEVTGLGIEKDKLAEKIADSVNNRTFEAPIEAEIETIEPKWTKEFLQQNMNVMGEYSTTFKDSAYGRRFNIWKMSTVVCGVVLMPGETWSINEAAGDRTTANGWADAAGIKNGAYVDEPGGGICQVSSTLYNAVLRSEVTVVKRSHHSWPLSYVPVGLDATISTGSPDFVISNPYDTPIILAVRCDASSERSIRVRIYGPEMDYKLDFTSEIVEEKEADPIKTTIDPSLSPGASKKVKPRHNALTVNIYKHVIDKSTGKEISKEVYKVERYNAFAGMIAYGPEPTATQTPEQTSEPAA